jgi:hypothetical protein
MIFVAMIRSRYPPLGLLNSRLLLAHTEVVLAFHPDFNVTS